MAPVWPLLRSFFFAGLFVSLQMYFLPRWFRLPRNLHAPQQQPLRWLGLVPLILGTSIMLWCVWRFATTGRGTPAPFDPPRYIVRGGLYEHVRNPMYWGMALALIGEAVLFAEWRPAIAIYAAALIVVINAFVLLYEEPALRRKFGAEYERYCAEVPRWFPKLRG